MPMMDSISIWSNTFYMSYIDVEGSLRLRRLSASTMMQ